MTNSQDQNASNHDVMDASTATQEKVKKDGFTLDHMRSKTLSKFPVDTTNTSQVPKKVTTLTNIEEEKTKVPESIVFINREVKDQEPVASPKHNSEPALPNTKSRTELETKNVDPTISMTGDGKRVHRYHYHRLDFMDINDLYNQPNVDELDCLHDLPLTLTKDCLTDVARHVGKKVEFIVQVNSIKLVEGTFKLVVFDGNKTFNADLNPLYNTLCVMKAIIPYSIIQIEQYFLNSNGPSFNLFIFQIMILRTKSPNLETISTVDKVDSQVQEKEMIPNQLVTHCNKITPMMDESKLFLNLLLILREKLNHYS